MRTPLFVATIAAASFALPVFGTTLPNMPEGFEGYKTWEPSVESCVLDAKRTHRVDAYDGERDALGRFLTVNIYYLEVDGKKEQPYRVQTLEISADVTLLPNGEEFVAQHPTSGDIHLWVDGAWASFPVTNPAAVHVADMLEMEILRKLEVDTKALYGDCEGGQKQAI